MKIHYSYTPPAGALGTVFVRHPTLTTLWASFIVCKGETAEQVVEEAMTYKYWEIDYCWLQDAPAEDAPRASVDIDVYLPE